MNYYEQIKGLFISNEVYKKIKDFEDYIVSLGVDTSLEGNQLGREDNSVSNVWDSEW